MSLFENLRENPEAIRETIAELGIIEVSADIFDDMYLRFRSYDDRMVEFQKSIHGNLPVMDPGIKGLELGLAAVKILAGKQEHETMHSFNNGKYDGHVPRPILLPIPIDGKDPEARLAQQQLKSFRLATYLLTKYSPLVTYSNTRVTAKPSIVAKSADEQRALLGQQTKLGVKPAFENGYYGGESNDTITNSYVVLPKEYADRLVKEYK